MSTRLFRFGPFRLDAGARTLLRDDAALSLAPKAFDCLLYLLEHRERAVGRDELIAAVWGKTDVSDGVLGQTILLIRRALDDTGKEHRYVRTVPRFGYHWLAAVTLGDAVGADSAGTPVPANEPVAIMRAVDPIATPTPTAPPTRPSQQRTWIIAMLTAVAIVCTAIAWTLLVRHRQTTAHSDAAVASNVAVVLPVSVINAADAAWMRLGLMDFIAARLRANGQAVVPSDNVVALTRAYERDSSDPAQLTSLAAAANADLIIDARAESLQGRWRVSLRTLRGHVPAVSAVGEADDALVAARIAADRMGNALGLRTLIVKPADATTSDPLQQEIAAALLDDELDVAQALLSKATEQQRSRPELRFLAGQIEFQGGRMDSSEALFKALADTTSATQEPVLHARALNALGAIDLQRQQPTAALPKLDAAIELLVSTQAFDALGKAYNNRAAAYGVQRDYDNARADLGRARAALETADDGLGVAVVDSNAGALAMNRDRFAEAVPVLTLAADRFASLHAYAAELNARGNAAQVHLALLDTAAAMMLEPRLRELDTKVSDPDRRRSARLVRAEILLANGLSGAADALLREVRAEAERDGIASVVARAQSIGARVELRDGAFVGAERDATAALKVPPEPQDPRYTAAAWLTLVRAQLALENDAGAADSIAAAARWAAQDGSTTARLHVALARAELAAAKNESGAERAFEDALAVAEQARVPIDVLEVSQAYVIWLLRQGNLTRASAVAEGVAAWSERDFDASLLQVRLFRAQKNPAAWRAALARARALAGERAIPDELATPF
jgi:DNA-binding winged helix-turn-helix (wHTH) protein/tetratricopeptide (TPR) repeat protein